MPTPDHAPRRSSEERLRLALKRAGIQRFADRLRRGKKRGDGEVGEGAPVEPNRPNNLSGGAAAALEFDE